ncbi:MAG: exodeoxyribonuclease V subunit gamma [Oceanospirillaceae bacterium]|nr:exodeoxyribonuclease V subunit gamma [Oceanospirillaceae bacterium]MBT13798.1 exodeoxyribonuclease V subunit gamma [Oceanospirillaceae bacterium]|tara:strand:- start:13733 stop:17257 length:3525 start_codon:yes stop_codon:yes gene_type:complete
MFRLYHSNDLEVLREILLNEMRTEPLSPFAQEAILVQSQGMAHWLKLQLADGLGIAAQVDFPLPSSFIWQVFNRLKPELPEQSHFDKQIMAWKLMRLLPQLMSDPACVAIRHYLEGDHDGLKCYQLAQTVADVFDQYLLYRPDWLLNWELGVDDIRGSDVSAHPWQPVVWRALVADSAELGHSLDHRARLLDQLQTLVKQYPERLQGLPRRLFVFGIAALPGSYWQVLQAISPAIDVHFFLLNPCRNFWGDIVSDKQRRTILRQQPNAAELLERGNPLLASWGRLGRDFLTLVHETAAGQTDNMVDIEAYVERQPASLLQYLQDDILNLIDRQQPAFTGAALDSSTFKQPVERDDGSIRLVSGHSPLREVQRLYDQILHWLDHDAELKPRDIVVMVPDIDQYAPYIDAVFASSRGRTVSGEDYRIPWAIADQSMAQEDPLIDSFLNLLNLADSRFLITEVQDWLDVAAIRHRFGISEDDLAPLRDWLSRAQVRWGLNGEQRRQLGLPAFEQNSWRKGLRQLLLGYAMPDSQQGFQGDFPVSAVEGNDGELLGRLMRFIDTLEHWQSVFSASRAGQEKTAAQWVDLLLQMLDDFYLAEDDEQYGLQKIRDAITGWHEELTLSGFQQTLSPVVVRSWFVNELGQQGGWQRFLAGPVNFCTLMPMRSIPFKAVCLLGMNDEDYPRRVTPVGFDLMVSGQPRRGDRSRREDDRYLFLEAVCSAQNYLYISYRGRDVRENAELQPSVLVAELQDYLCDGYCLQQDIHLPHQQSRRNMQAWLTEALPLQPYNRLTFDPAADDRAVISYQPVWSAVANTPAYSAAESETTSTGGSAAESFFSAPLPLPAELDTRQVPWEDVKQALLDPVKFFVKRRLKASFDIYWHAHETEEPFTLQGLSLFQLKEDWLQLALTDLSRTDAGPWHSDQQDFSTRQQALGQLPVNALGDVWSAGLVDDARPLAEQIALLSDKPLDSRPLETLIDDTRVQGERQSAFATADDSAAFLLFHWVGDIRGRHLLAVWLDLVLAAAADPGATRYAVLLGLAKEKQSVHLRQLRLQAPSQQRAKECIALALQWYWQIWQQPFPHLPDTLWSVMQAQQACAEKYPDDDNACAESLNKKLALLADAEFGELASPYLQRCLPDFCQHTLLADPAGWLADYGGLMQMLADFVEADDQTGGTV